MLFFFAGGDECLSPLSPRKERLLFTDLQSEAQWRTEAGSLPVLSRAPRSLQGRNRLGFYHPVASPAQASNGVIRVAPFCESFLMFARRFYSNSFCAPAHTPSHTHTHYSKSSLSVSKSVLVLLGLTKVLQTNIMGNNQLCSRPAVGLFSQAQMTRHNDTVFLIKLEVINLLISCSLCAPKTSLHFSGLIPSLFVSLTVGFVCLRVCGGRYWKHIHVSSNKSLHNP